MTSVTHELELTPAEFKRLLALDYFGEVIPALQGTEIDSSFIDYSPDFPNTVCFSLGTTEHPAKAIAAIEALLAKPKKSA